ncbi:VOC family protein [Nocardia sp. 2]|uniref:VOC family protein n=1 Tax=Nocardia acididurans TaxID=2802282 RepID=A0ABS1M2Z8_9NOCA|nr:VOC family protein [Nocardia acididurans]MBL1073508.1 VOC family protein [Nocardia acididurans]
MGIKLANITFDCENAAELAGFYAQLLELSVDKDANEHFATVGTEAGHSPTLMFLKVPDKNAGKNVVHLDLVSDDLPAQIDRAKSLGAKHIGDFDEYGITWSTLADPEGNLFDVAQG